MSNTFDKQFVYYFVLITTIIWASIYLVLSYFGYNLSSVSSNGNVLVPFIDNVLSWLIAILNTLTLTIFHSNFTDLYNQLIIFMNIWNLLNIYIFYILFIPYLTVLLLIFIDLVSPLFGS